MWNLEYHSTTQVARLRALVKKEEEELEHLFSDDESDGTDSLCSESYDEGSVEIPEKGGSNHNLLAQRKSNLFKRLPLQAYALHGEAAEIDLAGCCFGSGVSGFRQISGL